MINHDELKSLFSPAELLITYIYYSRLTTTISTIIAKIIIDNFFLEIQYNTDRISNVLGHFE